MAKQLIILSAFIAIVSSAVAEQHHHKHHKHHKHHRHHHKDEVSFVEGANGNSTMTKHVNKMAGNATAGAQKDKDPSLEGLVYPTVAPGPVDTSPSAVEKDAKDAKSAAVTAKHAAKVANSVAWHSIDITHHARAALHGARVDTSGLDQAQKEALRKAEEKLKIAGKKTAYGKLKMTKEEIEARKKAEAEGGKSWSWKDVDEELDKDDRLTGKLSKLEDRQAYLRGQAGLDKEPADDVDSLRGELRNLRETLAAKKAAAGPDGVVIDAKGTRVVTDDVSAKEMEAQLKELERMVAHHDKEGWKD